MGISLISLILHLTRFPLYGYFVRDVALLISAGLGVEKETFQFLGKTRQSHLPEHTP